MLNNSQTEQGREKMNAGFQRTGAGSTGRAVSPSAPGANRETAPTSGSKPRKNGSNNQTSATGVSSGMNNLSAPTHDEIADRAFQIYCQKGRPEGRDTENWLEAEAELIRERRGAAGAKR